MIKKQSTTSKSSKIAINNESAVKNRAPAKSKSYFYIALIIIVVFTAAVLMAVNSFNRMRDQEKARNQQTQINKDTSNTQYVISRVASLIHVKEDETPTVATIEDINILKSNNPIFYQFAENGDKLLIWSDKAVLYSTKQDKLLSVMPIDMAIQNQATTTSETITQTSTSTVASENASIQVRNGTRTAGLATKMSTKLKVLDLKVSNVTDAKSKDYENTIIVKLTDKDMPATLEALQKVTGASVVSAPAAETNLGGDFVVIVGNNFNP